MKNFAWVAALYFAAASPVFCAPQAEEYTVDITSKRSLAHLAPSMLDRSDAGTTGVKLLLKALDERDPEAARQAIDLFKPLQETDAFAKAYVALEWFAQYVIASEENKKSMLEPRMAKTYFRFFSEDRFARLKEYLNRQFALEKVEDDDPEQAMLHIHFLEDLLIYNNPRRHEWEETSKVLSLLNIRKGEKVADVGSGSGYYADFLSDMVGKKGKVQAVDIQQEPLNFLGRFAADHQIDNIKTAQSAKDNANIQEKVDTALMISTYHLIYITAQEPFRKKFVRSVKDAIKPGGRLIIVDTAPVEGSELLGSSVAPEILIGHFQHFGFKFKSRHEITPQRYMLVFENGR